MLGLVLFDLDGTLVDTAPDLAGAANRLRIERGLEPLEPECLRPAAARGARALIEASLGVTPEDPDFEPLRTRFLENYEAHLSEFSRPFPRMPWLLQMLRSHNIRSAVVTNKQKKFTSRVLSDLGLMPLLDFFLSSDSPGCALKPRPDSLLAALRLAGAGPQAACYVGDDPLDAAAARAAGLPCVLVEWGYSPEKGAAGHTASSPEELLSRLLAFR